MGKITCINFMEGYSEVFATCAESEIILWKNSSLLPILKISMLEGCCFCLNLLRDGTKVVSGWSDGVIRFLNPKTGKKTQQISEAHFGGVTALASNRSSDRLYSGGHDGRIRSWKLDKERFGIIDNIFTGHKATVHSLKLVDT